MPYFIFQILFFLYLLINLFLLPSCGLRTEPRNLPEKIQKSTLSELKVQQRGERLRLSWIVNQNANTNFLDKKVKDSDMQEYFLLRQYKTPIGCNDCNSEELSLLKILFSSESIIREGDHFYYYTELPQNYSYLYHFEISHVVPQKEILSTSKRARFIPNNFFPKVPTPNLKLIQIEDQKKTIRLAFGKVVLTKKNTSDDAVKIKSSELSGIKKSNSTLSENQPKKKFRTFTIRLSWSKIPEEGFPYHNGLGSFILEQQTYAVNLYRLRNKEKWSQIPINNQSKTNNYYIDELKLIINSTKQAKFKKELSDNTSLKIPFYIDLLGQNGDTWLYKLRLVDRFGNESSASKAIKVYLPKIKNYGKNSSINPYYLPKD